MEIQKQNTTLTGRLPLDRPHTERPHRLYVATSNYCNRSCPWCCTCSSPKGQTLLSIAAYKNAFPEHGDFEVQLEGGEPTIHPDFFAMVAEARAQARCKRIILVTNGVELPREESDLLSWLEPFGPAFTLKLSINHYLLEKDNDLLALAQLIHTCFQKTGDDRQLVLNVRLRPDNDADQTIPNLVEAAGLSNCANIFYLQRYGFAEKRKNWERPFIVGGNFSMLNPDGTLHDTNLIDRSNAMRGLK